MGSLVLMGTKATLGIQASTRSSSVATPQRHFLFFLLGWGSEVDTSFRVEGNPEANQLFVDNHLTVTRWL